MAIDNNDSLEIRPIVLTSVVEDGMTVVTEVESSTLDLSKLSINNFAHALTEEDSVISVSIGEQEAALLSLAILNPTEVILGELAFGDLGVDFGSGLAKTYRKLLTVLSVSESAASVILEMDPAAVDQVSLVLSDDGQSLVGKSADGFDISLDVNNLPSAGDSRYVEFVTRDDGIILSPKVTGLSAPVADSDAINLDYVDAQVATLEDADSDKLAYMDQKYQDLLPLIENQDSFFATSTSRWDGSKVVVVNNGEIGFVNPTANILNSGIIGIVLSNPAIDESGMTEEEIADSYERRVYTNGLLKNIKSSEDPFQEIAAKKDLFLGPDGEIKDISPTLGRVIKLGQKVNGTDMSIKIQDYGFLSKTVAEKAIRRKTYNFGPLEPTPRPPPPPPPPSGGLILHFRAEDITGLNDGDLVTQWNSVAGLNLTAYDNTSPLVSSFSQKSAPTYLASGLNGMPAVKFNENGLYVPGVNVPLGSDAFTIYAVFKLDETRPEQWNGYHQFITSYGNSFGAGERNAIVWRGWGPGVSLDNDNIYAENVPVSMGGACSFAASYPAGGQMSDVDLTGNGVNYLNGDGASGGQMNISSSNFTIGHNVLIGDFDFFFGEIYEIRLYDTCHDTTTRESISNQLAVKYGISI